jgi:hypothetical protein
MNKLIKKKKKEKKKKEKKEKKNIENNKISPKNDLENLGLEINIDENSNNSNQKTKSIENNKSNDSDKSIDSNKKLKLLKMVKILRNKSNDILNKKVINIENINYKNVNDYRFNFENKLDINDFTIENINFPKNTDNNITEKNNELKVIYNEKEHLIKIEEGYYNRYMIMEYLNSKFETNDIKIECLLNNKDEFIFKSNDGSIFELLDTQNCILNTLGLINGDYKDNNIYSSNYPIGLSDNIIYLAFSNIYDKPIFKINNDTNEIIKLYEIKDIKNISYLDITFYFTIENQILNQKYEYFYKKHNFNLIIK